MYSRVLVTGIVQSVGFRPFVKRLADSVDTTGHVMNLGSVGVEIVVEDRCLEEFLSRLKNEKPELAEIFTTTVSSLQDYSRTSFVILPSRASIASSFSPLPPDISICNECIRDLAVGRRKDYPFISCTNCGPRYAVIKALPYDREKTAFGDFPLCSFCLAEYQSKADRRFHAQTTCCNDCGPSYLLQESSGVVIPLDWYKLSSKIRDGKTLYMLGQSGSHFICDALNESTVMMMRKKKRHESTKPFALMARSIEVAEKYCIISEHDRQLLLSSRRPIVVLPIRDDVDLPMDAIAPGLDTVGIVLPYTSAQILLYKHGIPELVVLTSANNPGLPMPINNEEVIEGADYYLLHNLKIQQREDDSVIKSFGDESVIIRRARGYVPQPLHHPDIHEHILALGANEVVTGAFSTENWVTLTQHIGNMKNLENLEFLRSALTHLSELYNFTPRHLAVDLHPDFLNRRLIPEYGDLQLHEIQHHEAHVYSLLLDRNLPLTENMLVWAVDGFGYGHDGNAWGTELFHTSSDGIERLGSAVPVSYHGNDMNARYPARMLLSYLKSCDLEHEWLKIIGDYSGFSRGEPEYKFLSNKFGSMEVTTSSVARLLDAVSYLTGSCTYRSYRGEPAIRLEAIAGRLNIEKTDPFIKGNLIDSPKILQHVLEINGRKEKARFVHDAISSSLAAIAIREADELGIKKLGFTGGVAYNYRINTLLRNLIQESGIEFITHKMLPPGDGGISAGQVAWICAQLL